jgi:hypothetical protein
VKNGRHHPKDPWLTRQRLGFRDQDFLKLRLYALNEAKFKFVG